MTPNQQLNQNQKDSIPEVGDSIQASINHYMESNLSRWELLAGPEGGIEIA